MSLTQLHFRKFSKRGPLSSVLMGDPVDVLTVFWNECGHDPQNEQEADALLIEYEAAIHGNALDPDSMAVEKGVLRDPDKQPEWQKNVVYNLRKKAGV